ncbi:pseudouridine synthase [Niameybacter massiliensis]|uniref:Pseudouridine synthase n=1 Tax=Holtiella tumoricola TaxID=3018743 RepID=A0AA42DNU7_9FIRM|nr:MULTISPECIES: pseudouridine synthase [Lachnospirales]MDA3732494.1 pseudouridine synthase [Holtiella tumoricola]
MRLQKYLAQCGVGSRRKCEQYIAEGKVKVNGQVVTEQGVQVEEGDEVLFENQPVQEEEQLVYYLLNKPTGYITSVADEKDRPTVLDLVKNIPYRIFPVGRLDYNTTGLLILTNDGELTYALTHPKHHVDKTYVVKVKGDIRPSTLQKLQQGVVIDGYLTAPAKTKVIRQNGATTTFSLTIHEGRNRQVRKMCAAVGYDVLRLTRVSMGSLELGDLESGSYRPLTRQEVNYLKGLGE